MKPFIVPSDRWFPLCLRSMFGGCALLTVAACSTPLPEPTSADAVAASSGQNQVTVPMLDRGRELTLQVCAGCHALKPPHYLAPSAWPAMVEKMRNEQGVKLSDEDANSITAYLRGVAARSE